MHKNRLEAFSDGVMAIIITIMVLEIKVPHGTELHVLRPLLPVFVSYVLSFIYLAIYWNNHHHMMHTVQVIDGRVLWANMHLLFWLSLVPFATGWVGENEFSPLPLALYGLILLMAAIAYYILQTQIIRCHGENSLLAEAIGKDVKGKLSPALYIIAIAGVWFEPWIAILMYILVAIMWIIPDKRIEIIYKKRQKRDQGDE